jgi:hypothetical protein
MARLWRLPLAADKAPTEEEGEPTQAESIIIFVKKNFI